MKFLLPADDCSIMAVPDICTKRGSVPYMTRIRGQGLCKKKSSERFPSLKTQDVSKEWPLQASTAS